MMPKFLEGTVRPALCRSGFVAFKWETLRFCKNRLDDVGKTETIGRC